MPLVVKDRVRETSTTAGTGTFTLAGAVLGYQSFSAVGNGNTTYYTIYLQGGNEWEVGIGTYTASGTTLSRDTILASSNGGSAVNFSAGVKDVFVTYPAGRSVYYDTATNVTLNALTLSGGTANGVLYLNGSKAATSGSALTFDGATLITGSATNTSRGGGFSSALFYRSSGTQYIDIQTGASGISGLLFSTASTGNYGAVQYDNSGGSLQFFTVSSEQMRLTSTGLGIGTSSPGAKLDVQGLQNGISNPANGTINVVDTAAAALGVGGQIVFRGSYTGTTATQYAAITAYKESATVDGSQYGAALIFNTRTQGGNNTEKMRLDSSGNLGIGTNNPAAKLDVLGPTSDQIRVRTAATEFYRFGRNASTGFLDFYGSQTGYQGYTFGGVDGTWVTINSSGNLGLGVTPSAWISNRRALEIGGKAANVLGFPDIGQLYYNLYLNSSAEFVYKTTGYAGTFDYNYAVPGGFAWNLAASGTANTTTVTSGKSYTIVTAGGTNYTSFGAANNNVGTSFIATSSGTGNGGAVSEIVAYTQAMTLNASGNLGIGPTSPATKLDVAGTLTTRASTSGAGQNVLVLRSVDSGNANFANAQYYANSHFWGYAGSSNGMTLDSSGNLGLGVTPSAWSGVKAFDIGATGSFYGTGADLGVVSNAYYNGANWIYKTGTAGTPLYASRYQALVGTGVQAWFTAPTGVAGGTVSFTQAMTLDASGRLGIGTTSPGSFDAVADDLVVGNGVGNIGITIYSSDTGRGSILFADGTAAGGADSYRGFIEYDHSGNNFLRFGTNATERVRIASDGTVFMRDGTSTTNTNSSKLVVNGTISETVSSTQYLVASQYDIGTAANEIPLNQYLGNLAYQDAGSIAGPVGLGGAVTLYSGTANGVLYLNGSKVLTSGSALTFNGSDVFGVSGAGTIYASVTNTTSGSGSARLKLFNSGDTSDGFALINNAGASGQVNILNYKNSAMGFWTNSIERMLLDSSGNLGLGVTPTNNTLGTTFQNEFAALTADGTTPKFWLGANWYYNGGDKYLANGQASLYSQQSGQHIWWYASNNTSGAGAVMSPVQAMTLDASGNLLLGLTSGTAKFDMAAGSGSQTAIRVRSLSTNSNGFNIVTDSVTDNVYLNNYYNAAMLFGTNNTERARITSGGNLDLQKNIGLGGASATTSGTGITFPATQSASSNANTLDDYERGTFTATIRGSVSDPTTPVTSTAYYTKIGNQVSISIQFESVNLTGASGDATISGLPFSPVNTRCIGTVGSYGAVTWTGQLIAHISVGQLYVDLLAIVSASAWNVTSWNTGTGKYVWVNATYFV